MHSLFMACMYQVHACNFTAILLRVGRALMIVTSHKLPYDIKHRGETLTFYKYVLREVLVSPHAHA